jgi:hypothetical protein
VVDDKGGEDSMGARSPALVRGQCEGEERHGRWRQREPEDSSEHMPMDLIMHVVCSARWWQ